MIGFDDIIEGIKADYQWHEQNRIRENAAQIDRRMYVRQIFNMCNQAIDAWAARNRIRFADRYKTLLQMRYREGATLTTIAEKLKLSRERVRQLDLKLIEILQGYFREKCPEEFCEEPTAEMEAFDISPEQSLFEPGPSSAFQSQSYEWKGAAL